MSLSKFSHLHCDFLDVHERLDVLLRHVISGHGGEVGVSLLLHTQLPVVA